MILVFTGDGKGKTTAAMGTVMRALGHGKKVAVVQFVKGTWESGEELFARKLALPKRELFWVKGGRGFVKIGGDKLPLVEHKKAAEGALAHAERLFTEGKYDLVVLDEVNVAVDLKLIAAWRVLDSMKRIPQGMDVILTGRGAPKSFIAIADTVTEMKEIKHPFRKKHPAKPGIDF